MPHTDMPGFLMQETGVEVVYSPEAGSKAA